MFQYFISVHLWNNLIQCGFKEAMPLSLTRLSYIVQACDLEINWSESAITKDIFMYGSILIMR